MERQVADIMHRGVIGCHTDTPMNQVAMLMRDNDISSVIVVSERNELRGIITQSDMVKSLTDRTFERRPWTLLAEHLMTADVITTTPDTTLTAASQLMTERHIHRLVVVDHAQPTKPIGVCSMTDVVAAMADDREAMVPGHG
jgi:CBS domain-containing protein